MWNHWREFVKPYELMEKRTQLRPEPSLQTASPPRRPSTLVLFTQKLPAEDTAAKSSSWHHVIRLALAILQLGDAHLKHFEVCVDISALCVGDN